MNEADEGRSQALGATALRRRDPQRLCCLRTLSGHLQLQMENLPKLPRTIDSVGIIPPTSMSLHDMAFSRLNSKFKHFPNRCLPTFLSYSWMPPADFSHGRTSLDDRVLARPMAMRSITNYKIPHVVHLHRKLPLASAAAGTNACGASPTPALGIESSRYRP